MPRLPRPSASPPFTAVQAEEERASAAGSEKEEVEEEEEEEYDEEEEEEDDDRPAKKPRHGGFILDEAGELGGGAGMVGGPRLPPDFALTAVIPPQMWTMNTRMKISGKMELRTSWRKVRRLLWGLPSFEDAPWGFEIRLGLWSLLSGLKARRGWKRSSVVVRLLWERCAILGCSAVLLDWFWCSSSGLKHWVGCCCSFPTSERVFLPKPHTQGWEWDCVAPDPSPPSSQLSVFLSTLCLSA